MIVVERLLESSDLAPVTYLITTDPGVSTTYKTKNLKVWEYHSTIIVDICFIIYIRSTNNTHTSNTNLYTSLPFYLLVPAYITDFDSNLPGVANGASDRLSRRFQPGSSFSLPACLANASEVFPPPRTAEYFEALRPPPLW